MENAFSNIPDSLKEALKDKRVVPFIGAGVSMSVKKSPLEPLLDREGKPKKDKLGHITYKSVFPSWWQFLLSSADKLDREKIGPNNEGKSQKAVIIRNLLDDSPVDYLDIAQRAFDALGNRHWHDLLKENFEKDIDLAEKDSLKLAKMIWRLGSNLLVTTNVDSVLQSVHEKTHFVKILDTQKAEFAEIQRDWQPLRPIVLHLHGLIDNEANVVFTRKQYDEFYDKDKNQAKLETLRSLFTQRTILFIGFSLDDLFILRELERVNLIYKGAANSFYVLIRESEKDNPNIPGYVEKITFPDFGEPLEDLVEELTRIAESGGTSDPPIPTVLSKPGKDKPFFNVPFGSKGKEFVGRKGKIKEIWDLLTQNGCASIGQAVSVKGFGGLGKTQLAVEYAHAKRASYKNGVFWVVADENIENQLLQIGDRMEWINPQDQNINQAEVAREKFLALADCLILFDNVDDFDDIKDYLPKPNAQTHILITSREPIYKFRSIDLELLGRDESRELLLKISKRSQPENAEKEHLEQVLEILGDIPLAIELVGGYLAEHELITFAKYHQFLDEIPLARLEKEFPDGSFTNHDRSIIQTLRISEKTVNEKPVMVEILKVLAWSGSSSMGVSLLKALVAAENDFEFDNALSEAHKLRLQKKDKDAERFAIHRLLAKVIRHEKNLDKQKKWQTKIVRNVESWFNERTNRFETLAEFEAEIEHLETWHEQTLEYLKKEAVILARLRGNIPYQRGNYQTALDWFQKAFDLFDGEQPDNKALFADLLNDLGVIYGELGDHRQALKYQEKALELNKELFGEKHPLTANSYNNVGLTYGELGDQQQASKYQEKALEIYKELFGEKHPLTAASYNSVGYTYGELGDHQQALKYQEKALEIRIELFGEKHPLTANSYNNVGSTYGELGDHQQALKYLEKAVEIFQELLGKQHPKTIVFVRNLIITCLNLGDKEKAGKKAAEFLSYMPPNHPYRKLFENISQTNDPK